MKIVPMLLAAVALASAHAACAADRYSYSKDGAEVIDSKTGLVWRRCAQGQTWDGATCAGTPITFTHEQALQFAKTQTGWRLPNVKELSSIIDRSRYNPAVDVTAFPATFTDTVYWTSTPYALNGVGAWNVGFLYGGANTSVRSLLYYVRLVR